MDKVKPARSLDTSRESSDALFNPVLSRGYHLGGRRWRRSAEVRNKVCNGEISLMADGGHNWEFRSSNNAGKRFVVESCEVLQRSTTASEDDDID
jgi:hypothetical protein